MKPQAAAAALGMILAASLVSAEEGEKARKEFTVSCAVKGAERHGTD